MKNFVAIFTIFAVMNLSFAKFAIGGEVEKKPLNLQEMVELTEEQARDYEETRDTEAGLQNGYGIFALLLAGAVAYFVVEAANNN